MNCCPHTAKHHKKTGRCRRGCECRAGIKPEQTGVVVLVNLYPETQKVLRAAESEDRRATFAELRQARRDADAERARKARLRRAGKGDMPVHTRASRRALGNRRTAGLGRKWRGYRRSLNAEVMAEIRRAAA